MTIATIPIILKGFLARLQMGIKDKIDDNTLHL